MTQEHMGEFELRLHWNKANSQRVQWINQLKRVKVKNIEIPVKKISIKSMKP